MEDPFLMLVGARVYYRDNGKKDRGTIIGITPGGLFVVRFDEDLGPPDEFRADQLKLI